MDELNKIEIQRPVDYMLWEDLVDCLNCFGVSPSDSYHIDDDGRFLLFSAHGIPAQLPPIGTDFLAVTWRRSSHALIPVHNSSETREVIYWGVVVNLPPNCTHIAWQRDGAVFGNTSDGFAVEVPIPVTIHQNFLLMVERECDHAEGVEVGYSLETTQFNTPGVRLLYRECVPEVDYDYSDESFSEN